VRSQFRLLLYLELRHLIGMKPVRYQHFTGYFSYSIFNKYEIEISSFPAEIRISNLKIKGVRTLCSYINVFKLSGYVMHHQLEHFNKYKLCPHCIYVFRICLRTNSDLCHIHKKFIGFCNRDEGLGL
jgi:hypothetical protein